MAPSISRSMPARRRSQLFDCATAIRRSTTAGVDAPFSAWRMAAANASAVAATDDDVAVVAVEAANLRQVRRDDRNAHAEVFVQLRRIDVRGVVGEQVRHDADVELLHVLRQVGMRALAEQRDVRAALERRHVGLRRPDEREAHLGQPRRDGGQQRLIDPLMQAADVADDRPLERREVGRRRVAALAHGLEPLEVHAERKQMHADRMAGGALTQLLGRDEHEIRLPEQLLFARDDLPGAVRARRQVVDAVVDRHLRIDGADHVERERRRQERPENRPAKPTASIQRRSARDSSDRLIQRASREYGSGSSSGE